jgi:hypothetical protein
MMPGECEGGVDVVEEAARSALGEAVAPKVGDILPLPVALANSDGDPEADEARFEARPERPPEVADPPKASV